MAKFANQFRIESARMQEWDYSWPGAYYITISTKRKENFFGEILQGEMVYNFIGKIAFDEWFKTSEIRPDMNLTLGEFVVMPNHLHGIINIGKNQYNRKSVLYSNEEIRSGKKPSPQTKNLSSIIRGFKSAVTTQARIINIPFAWQPRFHDHIIRSHDEYLRISEYIKNNAKNWNTNRE